MPPRGEYGRLSDCMNVRRIIFVIAVSIRTYIDKNVSRAASSLSYFLMLSVFPTFVCLYEMLGSMFPTPDTIRAFATGLLPAETLDTIVEYLGYITLNRSRTMLMMAIVAMATTSAAAYRTLDNIMGEIRGSKRFNGPFAVVFSFLFAIIFLAAVYFAVIVMISGSWFINFLSRHVTVLNISTNWNWARFILLFLLLFVIILGLYRITAPKRRRVRLFTGALVASVSLVGVSIIFSYFIGMSVKYPLIYGSLASVMILMLWFYLCGNIVISGNIINVVLERM